MIKKTTKNRTKKKRLKTYNVIPFNIHIKGPIKNKGYSELFSIIEKNMYSGSLIVKPNSKGVVIRCLSGKYIKAHNASIVSLLKYNENTTGLAYDLDKDILISDTKQVSAQVVTGVFLHEHHLFMLIPKPHGPSDLEIEDYLEKIFDLAVGKKKSDYSVNVEAFKQKGITSRIESWNVIKYVKIEVFKNNPVMDDLGNNLSEIAELLESDKLDITARTRAKSGINKEQIMPILEAGDRLILSGRARITAEGMVDDEKDFIDTKTQKTLKVQVKSYEDDDGGLVGKIKDTIHRLINRR